MRQKNDLPSLIIILLLLLIALLTTTSVSAVTFPKVEAHGIIMSSSGSESVPAGFKITTNKSNMVITSCGKYPGSTVTNCLIINSSFSVIGNGTFAGNTANFTTTLPYVGVYYVVGTSNGATYTQRTNTSTFPKNGEVMNWTSGGYCTPYPTQGCTGWNLDNTAREINNITFNSTIPPVYTTTLSLANAINGSSWPNTVSFSNVTGTLTFNYFNITGTGFCVTYTGNGTGTNCTSGSGASTYFNVTNTTVITTTQTLNMTTYQALLNISAYRLFLNTSIVTLNVSNGLLSNNTATAPVIIPALNGSNTITVNVTGNYSKTITCTITTPLSTGQCNATGIYDNQYTIGAKTVGGTGLSNFTVNVTNSTLGGTLYSSATTNGSIIFPLLQGYTYYMIMQATGYAWDNKSLASNTSTQLYNFSLYQTNTINFTFYDENNGSNMNGTNITLNLISDVQSATYNTVNGSIVTAILSPDEYTVRYSATGFAERFYQFTLTNNTYYQIALPMLLSSAATSVTVSVIDNTAVALEGAIVTVYKYDITTNTYKVNQIFTTNNEGEGVIDIELNNEFYYFTVEYQGSIQLTTSPSYIYASTLQLVVLLNNPAFTTLFNEYGITGTITNTTPSLYTFQYADGDNVATSGCLYAYQFGTYNLTLRNSTCNPSSGGTVSVNIDSQNNYTFYLYGVVTKNSNQYVISSRVVSFTQTPPTEESSKIWLAVMTIIIIIMVAMFRNHPGIAAIIAGLIPVLFSGAHLIPFGLGYTVPLFIVSIIIAWIAERD